MTILTSYKPRGANTNMRDVLDLFIGGCRCAHSAHSFHTRASMAAGIGDAAVTRYFSAAAGEARPRQRPKRVHVAAAAPNETCFLPCSPRLFLPCSSALPHHKWRHPVSCREIRKRENYVKEMENHRLGAKWQRHVAHVRSVEQWQSQNRQERGDTLWLTRFDSLPTFASFDCGYVYIVDMLVVLCKKVNL